jgi:hypothetical protein
VELATTDQSLASDQQHADRQTAQKQTSQKSLGRPVAEVVYLAAQVFFTAEFLATRSNYDDGNKDAFSVRFVLHF